MYIQSLDRFTNRLKRSKCEEEQESTDCRTKIQCHFENYSTIASMRQSKKKRVPIFVAAKQMAEKNLPEKNIFTSKGIIETSVVQTNSMKKPANKLKIKYHKRQKCQSFCDKLAPHNPICMARVKTPKIMIKSVFNFSISQRKFTKSLQQQSEQPLKTKTSRKPATYIQRKLLNEHRFLHTSSRLQKNQFIGWQTETLNDYLTL